MNVTILGSSCSVPRLERACSGYLIENAGRTTVLDLGHGAFANMRRYVDYDRVDEIVISHMHADHFFDLVPLRYALRYGGSPRAEKVALHLPPGGTAAVERIAAALSDEGVEFFTGVFAVKEYDPMRPLRSGQMTLTFAPTRHFIPAFAIRCASDDGAALTYSADTAPEERVVALARESDLFLCEATLRPWEREGAERGHSTAAEAGSMASAAGARRLLLTHYQSGSSEDELRRGARETFAGEVIVADDHVSLGVGG